MAKKRGRRGGRGGGAKRARRGPHDAAGSTHDAGAASAAADDGRLPFADRNAAFETYYSAQGIVPEEEWAGFLATLGTRLPVTMRINASRPLAESLAQSIVSEYSDCGEGVEEDGRPLVPPRRIPWYPDQLAIKIGGSRHLLRRHPALAALHALLVRESNAGNLTRQEEVSMVPPLLLDVHPHHKVLDMCAAPGSKTTELIELVHRHQRGLPEGMVVANDADTKRATTMAHQCKRLNSCAFAVTVHPAQSMPSFGSAEDGSGGSAGYFDRIMCDVPCSGDGTLRKNPDIWRTWSPRDAHSLHRLQLQIAWRGLELLKVGGIMVYSTCSFNPVENEAVVAELLRLSRGSVQLCDVSARLPALPRRPGLRTWRVATGEPGGELQWHDSCETVPEEPQRRVHRSAFPPPAHEADALGLSRCLRFLPHDSDSGGFFAAVLTKTGPLPASSGRARVPEDAAAAAAVAGSDEGAGATAGAGSAGDAAARTDSTAGSAAADAVAPTSTSPAPAARATRQRAPRQRGRGQQQLPGGLAPLQAISEEAREQLRSYYGLAPEFPVHLLFGRADRPRVLNLAAPAIAAACLLSPAASRLTVTHCGVEAFKRADNQEACPFRLTQDGAGTLSAYVTRRVVALQPVLLVRLLRTASGGVPLEELPEEVRTYLAALSEGSVLVVPRADSDADLALLPDALRALPRELLWHHCAVAAWRGQRTLAALTNEADARVLRALLGAEEAHDAGAAGAADALQPSSAAGGGADAARSSDSERS